MKRRHTADFAAGKPLKGHVMVGPTHPLRGSGRTADSLARLGRGVTPASGSVRRRMSWRVPLALAMTLAWPVAGAESFPPGETTAPDPDDLAIEDLVRIRVSSIARREQDPYAAPGAFHVLSQEELHRTGVNSIPDALRFVPGLQVARLGAHDWAITSRGFNGLYANKLLVLMDGRSVYTPLFSGVFWDVQDTLMEDIDRIEVVRGPGGTLWGANALNGVISVVTKSARHTQGGLVTGGGGTEDRASGAARYGGQIGEDSWYRVYGGYLNRDDSALAYGEPANDSAQMLRGGFRMDWEPADVSRFTLQGDVYAGWLDQTATLPILTPPYVSSMDTRMNLSGGNVLGRWVRTIADGNEVQVQTYFDHTSRESGFLAEDRNTLDIDSQHHVEIGDRNDLIWGLGFRVTGDQLENRDASIRMDPDAQTDLLFSAFAQDELTLVEDRLKLLFGSKFEHNDYTGFEIQPSARLAWTPWERHTLWTSVTRAVRTPSRAERGISLQTSVVPGDPPTAVTLFGSDRFRSEALRAFELGYGAKLNDRISLDVATFYNDYDHLSSTEVGMPFQGPSTGTPYFVQPLVLDNLGTGHTYGAEASGTVKLTPRWRMRAGYTFLESHLELEPESTQLGPTILSDPRHQFYLHSSFDLPADLHFDAMVRYVDELKDGSIPGYVGLDLRLAWQPRPNLEFSVIGKDLLDNQHPEFNSNSYFVQPGEVERSVYAKFTLRF